LGCAASLQEKARYFLALTLKPREAGQGTVAQAVGGEEEYAEAELAFPNIYAPLPLLRRVLEQLQPLLEADQQGRFRAAAKAGKQARDPAPEPKKDK
jgi:hypothetical protein